MEIPMHPDECAHGNTHIEGVNECVICQRDRLVREVATLQADNEKLRNEAWAATSWASGHNCGEENLVLYERAGLMESERNVARAEIETLQTENDRLRTERACPCVHIAPCHDRCACLNPLSSSGCRRCAKYGSREQQRSAAARIASAIAVYETAVAWAEDKGTESSWNRPNESDERLRKAVREARKNGASE